MDIIKRINHIAVDPNLLVDANERIQALNREAVEAGEKPSYEGAIVAVLSLLDERGLRNSGMLLSAIIFRMEALTAIIRSDAARAWTMRDGSEFVLANEAVFKAAAICPLNGEGNKVVFDQAEFLRIALQEAEGEGRA